MNHSIIFKKSRHRLKKTLFTHIMLIYLDFWLLDKSRYPLFWKICILLLIYSGLFHLRRLFTKKPLLELSEDGIREGLTTFPSRHIPWEEIEKIDYQSFVWGEKIIIYLKDFGGFVKTQPLLSRLNLRVNQIFFRKKGVILETDFLEDSPQLILERIKEYQASIDKY